MGICESKSKNCQGLPLNRYARAVQVSDGVLASGRYVDFIFTASKKKKFGIRNLTVFLLKRGWDRGE